MSSDRYAKAASAYQKLDADLKLHGKRIQADPVTGAGHVQGSAFSSSAGGLNLQSARMRQFARSESNASPYSSIIIKRENEPSADMLVGHFEETWEALRNSNDQGSNWLVEAQVGLSAQKLNRCIRISLIRPEVSAPDMRIHTMSQHFENMAERRQRDLSKSEASWNFFFEEPPERFDDVNIPAARRDQNITIDGILRLFRSIRTHTGPNYAVDGNPVYRLGLESSCGIVFRGSHLDEEAPVLFIKAWLYDMVEFTSGEGRHRRWDRYARRYVHHGENARSQKETVSLENILADDRT